ncbi:MAG TPA: head GIN domain-containing protein [Croceibacterium sp.]|nr:head GIN domain-containing protein [Croceibacterium sp.]
MDKVLTMVSAGALAALSATMGAAQDGTLAAGEATSRSYALADFESIAVVGPHHVVVSVGPAFSVRAEGPQQSLADTEVEVENGRLQIHPIEDQDHWDRRCGRRDDGRHWRCWDDYKPATFYVTLPRIEAASLVGGGDMRIDRVEGNAFRASVAGSGDLDVGSLRVDDAHFSIAGSGDLVARGSARHSRVSIAGSGNLQAREVNSTDASVSIAGSGNAALTVQEAARVSLVGSGDVEISGPARCSVSRFGGGKVRCDGETVSG